MSNKSQDLLTVENLQVDFHLHDQGMLRAVDGVSFRVRAGSTVALVGESGSGKSVISQCILGILPKSARIVGGSIWFNDTGGPDQPDRLIDIAGLHTDSRSMRAIRGGRISMIFQEPMTSLSPLHTVGSQIIEAVLLHRSVSIQEAEGLAEFMLAKVGFPDAKKALRTYPFELSGGLRQRAMIAMALVCRPTLLIADEPTTALDVTIQAQILQLVQELQTEFHMAVLLITHDLGVVANMAEEVVVVYHGKLMESGTLESIFTEPRHPYLIALMRAVPRVGMATGERLTPLREVETPSDSHLLSRERWPQAVDAVAPLLRVSGVSKSYELRAQSWFGEKHSNSIRALDGVSFEIERGECLGLVGESGCGKTTISKIIMRALAADEGEVWFSDRGSPVRLDTLSSEELIQYRKKIQFIFQDPFSSLNPRMTVFDIISEPLIIHKVGDRAARIEIVKELMAHVGLDPRFLSRYPHSFSGGQRQRIGIARALALNPELLICDEPVSALDVSVQAQILNLLKDLQKELGLTFLFISHNLAVVDYMADRIAVMCAGRLVELAPRDVLFRNPIHPYTRALLAAVPRTDLEHRLDFGALLEGKASQPDAWEHPFTENADLRPDFLELEQAHYIRAHPSAELEAMVK